MVFVIIKLEQIDIMQRDMWGSRQGSVSRLLHRGQEHAMLDALVVNITLPPGNFKTHYLIQLLGFHVYFLFSCFPVYYLNGI